MSGSIRSRIAKQRKRAGEIFFESRGQISFEGLAAKMEAEKMGFIQPNVLENWMKLDKWQELLHAPIAARKMPHDPGNIAEAVLESSEKLFRRAKRAKARGGVVVEADVIGVITQTHRCVLALAQTLAQRMMEGLEKVNFDNESRIAMGAESLERIVEASQKVDEMLANAEGRRGEGAGTIPTGIDANGAHNGEILSPPPIRRPSDPRLATATTGLVKAAIGADKKGAKA